LEAFPPGWLKGLGFRVKGLGLKVKGLVVEFSEFRVRGIRVSSLRFGVEGVGCDMHG
jgi:hypothetical protein